MGIIKVYITNRQKEVKIPSGLRLLVRKCCHAVLQMEHFDGSAEVSVSFVNNKQIHELNNNFRKKDSSTDVLSFPLGVNGKYDVNAETGALMLGDVVISMQTAMDQAERYDHSLNREVGFLTVHSLLHLLGYDHEGEPIDALRMREKEEFIMSSLGLERDTGYASL